MIKGLGATLGLGAFAAAIAPLTQFKDQTSLDEFLQRALQGTRRRRQKSNLRPARRRSTKNEYGAEVTIRDPQPIPGVRYGYAINLSLCNGNGKCVEACHRENNHDRATNQSYIRVFEMPKGTTDMEQGTTTYDHAVPQPDKFYLPVQCFQCENPPCVEVCPVEATWQEEDGIVVVDYNWCIGCRYCQAACPYHARRFNWREPRDSRRGSESRSGLSIQPHSPAGGDGEMPLLPAPHARRPAARLLGSVPDRRPHLRQSARSRIPKSAGC